MKQLLVITSLFLVNTFCIHAQDKYLDEGNTFLNNGQYDKAEKTFSNAIKSDSSNLIYQCQLGLALIEQSKYTEAEVVLNKVLRKDSNNVAATWYSGMGNFKNGHDRQAIAFFEKTIPLLDKNSGQYYGAHWFIGKSYSFLLKTEGILQKEADRMFECFDTYLQLQPNANDAIQIREYVERKKKRRPPPNVIKWMDM